MNHPSYNRKVVMKCGTRPAKKIEGQYFRRTLHAEVHFATAASEISSLLLLAMLALLAACDSNTAKPPEAKPEPKGPELLTGRAAFQKVFIAARNYARDVKPFRIESTPTTDGNGHDGKSAIWRASFASPTQRGVKPFIWSGSNAPDAPSPRSFSRQRRRLQPRQCVHSDF
jgi:hypothetical protein